MVKSETKELLYNVFYFLLFAEIILLSITAMITSILSFSSVDFTLALLVVAIIPIIVAILAALDLIPQQFGRIVRNYGPYAFALIIVGIVFVMNIFAFPTIVSFLSGFQIDTPEAFAFSISLTFFIASIVLLKGFISLRTNDNYLQEQTDLHGLVMLRLSHKHEPVFTELRQRNLEVDDRITFDTNKMRYTVEIVGALFIILLSFIIEIRILDAAGIWQLPESSSGEFIPEFFLVIVPFVLFDSLYSYRIWRRSWSEYWFLIRMLTAPEGVILDSLGRLSSSLYASVRSNLGNESKIHSQNLARKYKIDKPEDILHQEYVNWYDRTFHKLESLNPELKNQHLIFSELEKEFDSLGVKFPRDDFIHLIRRFSILDATHLANYLPSVFNTVVELFNNKHNFEDRIDTYELSINQFSSLQNLGIIPIPSSISWLLGFFLISLSIMPYAISLASTILNP